jgi:hypothetical protein
VIRTLLAIIACAMLVGFINGQSLAQCEKAGNAKATCYAAVRP